MRKGAAAAVALAMAACLHAPPPRPGAEPRAEAGEVPGALPHVEPDLVGVVHVVRRGETVYRIARTYGLDPKELLDVNGLDDPRQLEVGSELFIPGAERELEVPPLGADGAPARAEALPKAPLPGPPPARRGEGEATAPRVAQAPTGDVRLRWPVQGVLYSRFGVRQGQRHDGIDIAAPEGTPVGAAAEGTVVYAGKQAGYGELVIVRHAQALLTVYAHASELLVHQGEQVAAGQAIARVGRSGRTTGPHLHFEVREGTRPANPLLFLR